jgi:two-component system nitrate/nitrite response regulator NarP
MNGIEATALLRTQESNIAIIALSQNQNPAMIDAVIKAGANAYLSKEVQTEELIRVIKHAVHSH